MIAPLRWGGKSGHPFSGNRGVSKASLTATGNKREHEGLGDLP